MGFVRYVFQTFLGIAFGYLCAFALSPLLASIGVDAIRTAVYLIVGVVVLIVGLAPSVRRSFGRSFLLLGVCVFALPLSAFVLSGVALNETVTNAPEADAGFAALGGVVAGGIFTVVAGFVGFILGTILLVIGMILALGGRREVVVVERAMAPRKEPRI